MILNGYDAIIVLLSRHGYSFVDSCFFIALITTINIEGEEKTSDDIVEFTKAILTAIKVIGFLTLLTMVFILIRSLM